MRRWIWLLLSLALFGQSARAHFIWIVLDGADKTRAKVIFSETLEPDDAVPIEKIGATRLWVRDNSGKCDSIEWKKGQNAYVVAIPEKDGVTIGGECVYGLLKRGNEKPFLLAYYPKLVRGKIKATEAWDKLRLEIVPKGDRRFQVIFAGKPSAGDEITVVSPGDGKETLKSDPNGEFSATLSKPGLYGIRARHTEAKPGEFEKQSYEEVRHYATLVFEHSNANDAGARQYPPLPEAVSSFGAATADGWLYVYGGHRSRTHQYSTEAVLGAFYRLNLTDPKKWEELPSGMALQGLEIVAHDGKIYRIGGMKPLNKPGEKTDNQSTKSCACFDPATRKWADLPDLPEGRSSHDAVAIDGKIVVTGGWNMNGNDKSSDWHTTTLILDLKQKPLAWQSIKQPFERRALTATPFNGKVYVMGGISSDDEIERTVNIYDPTKDAWTTGPKLPGPNKNGFAPASCVAGDRLFASTGDGKVVRLSAKGDKWEVVGQLKQPRIVHRMVAGSDNVIVVVGGALKGDNIALTETVKIAAP